MGKVKSLSDLAGEIGGKVVGDGTRLVRDIRPLEDATERDLTFVAHPRHRVDAQHSRAGAILVSEGETIAGRDLLVVKNLYLAVSRLIGIFHSRQHQGKPVRREAYLGEGCRLGEGVSFGPGAIIGDRCRIGDRVTIQAGTVLGEEVEIGDESILFANVSVYQKCRIGRRVVIHSGTVIGSDGFGYAREEGVYHKIPQLGNVVIEDDVEIGANCTVDRATFNSTIIGRGTKMDNLIQIGHNCRIGEHCALVAQVGLSGSVRLGNRVAVGGQAGSVGHIVVGEDAQIGARSVVTRDIAPGSYVMGHPATDHRLWKRAQAVWNRLPQILRRIRSLEEHTSVSRKANEAEPRKEV